jgi:hypothetical protein
MAMFILLFMMQLYAQYRHSATPSIGLFYTCPLGFFITLSFGEGRVRLLPVKQKRPQMFFGAF